MNWGVRMPFWMALGAVMLSAYFLSGCAKKDEPVSTCLPSAAGNCEVTR